MKKLVQLSLFLLLISIAVLFYMIYFQDNKKPDNENLETNNATSENIENNLIKNLKYEVIFENNNQYIISAALSEISYENDIEIVFMQQVLAKFIDENNIELVITSDKAIYDNSNYNTNFEKNIVVKYKDNTIFCESLNLNFDTKFIKIYDNVVYEGPEGAIKTDNVLINLITKDIEMFMEESKEKVEIKSK